MTITNRSTTWQRGCTIGLISLLGILSNGVYPHSIAAQNLSATSKANQTTYEDDKIRVVIQDCNRKLQDLICQAILTSKNGDRPIDLNGSSIKLIDMEGNEYYPSSLKLANRPSANNSIKTDLVENVPFRASFVFSKVPANVTKIALLQIPLGGVNSTAKFRNLAVVDPNSAATTPAPTGGSKPTRINPDVSSDNSLICPDNTKVMYRAISKHYSMYICGGKTPTHYVGQSRDGSEGITLRLRYYDRTRFSADNGETNYTIAADKLTISKDNKIVYQEKIEVVQPMSGTKVVEAAPVPKRKAAVTTGEGATTPKPKRKVTTVTTEPTPTPKRKPTKKKVVSGS